MYILDHFRPIFLSYLEQNKFDRPPTRLYEPADYIMQLGGKRLRPILVLAACETFCNGYHQALPAALSIEIFHNFTLVHDDIMDEAEMRRGKTTVHKKYNLNTAILSGDLLLIEAYKFLSKLNHPSGLSQIYDIFNNFAMKVCEGQQYDIDFETQTNVSIEAYLEMIELKTAVLIAGALEIGAILGGAEKKDITHLGHFGRAIGIAFQIQDDYLDTFGNIAKFGKKLGGDIIQGKKTYLFLKALEVANDQQAQDLKNIYFDKKSPEQEKINQVKDIFKVLDIPDLTVQKRNEYYDIAINHLSKVGIPTDKKMHLIEFANALIDREV